MATGKAVGLSAECYPDAVLQDLPHFYPFIVNNPVRAHRPSGAPTPPSSTISFRP